MADGPLVNQKIGIQWDIPNFNIHCAVAKAFFGNECHDDLQFDVSVDQKPYYCSTTEVANRWIFFLKKPHEGNFFSVGVTRRILKYHEGIQSEPPFGIKTSFKIECLENQANPIFTVDSGVFQLKHGESKEWQVTTLNTFAREPKESLVSISGSLEILPLPWNHPDIVDGEEARNQESVLKVSKDIGDFFSKNAPVFSDLTIKVVNGNQVKTFPVHRCIITARSPVLKQIVQDALEGFITIEDISPAAMYHFLAFLYSAELNLSDAYRNINESGDIIINLVYAADKYKVPTLKALCDQKLDKFFTFSNAYKMFDLCVQHNLASYSKIENYISENTIRILEQKKMEIEEAVMDQNRATRLESQQSH